MPFLTKRDLRNGFHSETLNAQLLGSKRFKSIRASSAAEEGVDESLALVEKVNNQRKKSP
jgi:hypothetical protein